MSRPTDFTPACTSGFIGFAKYQDEFAATGVELIGLSIDEVHRLVVARQTAAENKCAMPEYWRPRESVIVPPPATVAAAETRAAGKDGDDEVADWFFAMKAV